MLFRSRLFSGLSVKNQKQRLILSLVVFVIVLAIPLSFLAKIGYDQFQKDVLIYHHWTSKNVARNTASDYEMRIKVENNRPIDDYQFYKARNGHYEAGATLSPLASIPEQSAIPGLISYFQVDESGTFSCPLLPTNATSIKNAKSVNHILSENEIEQRLALREEIKPILEQNGLLPTYSESESGSDFTDEIASKAEAKKKHRRAFSSDITKISTFKTRRSENGKLIFYRDIWQGENKLIQGFIVDEKTFLLGKLTDNFREAGFRTDTLLQLYYKDTHLSSQLRKFSRTKPAEIQEVSGATATMRRILADQKIPAPLDNYRVVFSADRMPIGEGTKTGAAFLAIIIAIIIAGLFIFYRLGIQQINLNEERLNFVSSVSHELKTPLTSIIMYADMLRSGMVSDQKKLGEYYNYIFFEGERLGRLIGNVLRLSKLGQDRADISLEYVPLSTALDLLRSKTSTVLENNGFNLKINYGELKAGKYSILIDRDAFTQVTINLIDNAVKFTSEYLTRPDTSVNALSKQIDVNVGIDPKNSDKLRIGFRDYGPGISSIDQKHIFKSFYRAGNELTRKTTGTGMGLALVSELAQAMEGHIEFFNRPQGAEFIVSFQFRES